MKGRYCTVTFRPGNRIVRIETGTTVLEAAVQADIILEAPCGGKGRCGKCRVLFAGTAFPLTEQEEQLLPPADIANGVRLACRARVTEDCLVEIPPESQAAFPQALTFTPGDEGTFPFAPPLQSIPLTDLDRRLRDARTSDIEVLRELSGADGGDAELPLEFLQVLPERLRDSDAVGTAVVMTDGSFLGLTAVNREVYGVALDIGTTTVAAALMELSNGTQLSVASRLNAQAVHGGDTISRINVCSTELDGLTELNRQVIDTVNDIIEELSDRAQVDPDDIWEMTVVGNTTMMHLFLGVSPKYLGLKPYTPVFRRPPRVRAARLGLKLNPSANVHVLPCIGSFVGADSVGVILTSGMRQTDATTIAVDIGTNGEILLGSNHRLLASSTAAGPALEGAEISCGMRAAPGAVERVMVEDDDLGFEVIGNGRPVGLCGSGLVDLVAILVQHGVVDPGGRLLGADEMPHPARACFARRMLRKPEGNELVIYRDGGCELRLTQRDIRKIQLAKAAIRAGIEILKTEIGARNDDINAVFLAGAFGNYINKESAVAIGLLPRFPLEKIKPVGNAAGAGAKLALLSRQARLDALEIANNTEHVELGGRQAFQDAFADAMMFAEAR